MLSTRALMSPARRITVSIRANVASEMIIAIVTETRTSGSVMPLFVAEPGHPTQLVPVQLAPVDSLLTVVAAPLARVLS